MATRLQEALNIMKKLYTELHVPRTDPGAKELSRRLSDYVKTGKTWTGYIAILSLKRHLHVILPSNPAMEIRVVLKSNDLDVNSVV
jgi:hypothetical protein